MMEGALDSVTPANDQIGYHALTQAALRGVVRAVLEMASKRDSLPGDHHFYITFRTHAPGVQMADYLKDKFPDEMTIVVQHQYWDFEVFDDRFEIILKFSGVPQHLRIPWTALTRFFDPSVSFGLQLDAETTSAPALEVRVAGHAAPQAAAQAGPQAEDDASTVVSLDAFRRK